MVFETAKFAYATPSLPRNFALGTFGELLILFSTKVNLLYLFYSMDWRCCLLHLIKQNYLLKTFVRTLILMTLVSLCLFSLLELIWNYIFPYSIYNISITSKMVKKVITNLDSSKVPNCIPAVIELSYILVELFNICLKDSCFPVCWKVSSVVPIFKNVGERSTAKNYYPANFLSGIKSKTK